MKNLLTFIAILFFLNCFGQEEKRLALVIGNSNYNIGELKNPINDANLIAETLDSIGFDVLLHANLETKKDFISSINEFGDKISEYDVSFFYYAGHGVQIDNKNFLLPTKEVYETQIDVQDYGVSLQGILDYIGIKNRDKINIVTIDACRDNPFEKFWNKDASIKSSGLAKVNPPPGFITAFSTESGEVAPDGDGENSIYSKSLSENLYMPAIPIEQVFKDVRFDVLELTNGLQKPIESNTLIGDEYIINKLGLYELEKNFIDYVSSMLKEHFGDMTELDNIVIGDFASKIFEYDKNNIYGIIANLIFLENQFIMGSEEYLFLDYYSKIDLTAIDQKIKNFLLWLNYNSNLGLYYYNWCDDEFNLECEKLLMESKEIAEEIITYDNSEFLFYENRSNYDKIYEIDASYRVLGYYFGIPTRSESFRKIAYEISLKYIKETKEKVKDYYNNNLISEEDYEFFKYDELVYAELIVLTFLDDFTEFTDEEIRIKANELYNDYPNNSNLLYYKIRDAIILKQYETAEKLIDKVMSIDPEDPEGHFLRYLTYLEKSKGLIGSNDYFNAYFSLQNAIKIISEPGNMYKIDRIYANIDNSYSVSDNYLDFFYENRLEVWDLLLLGISLLEKIGNKDQICTDYNYLLEYLTTYQSYSDDFTDDERDKIYIEVLTKFPKDCQVWEWIQENELYVKLSKKNK